jgi:hypothetical protein
MLRALVASFLIAASTLAVSQAALAQPAPDGLTAYPAAFFKENQPATALDMIKLVPGFRLQNGDSGIRGFSGTVGNVLIDGQPPTSKEESLEQILGRIASNAVERIELIRGAAEMYGHPILANVVRVKTVSMRGRAEVEGAINLTGSTAPRIALSITRQGTDSFWDASVRYGRSIGNNLGFGRRDRFTPGGAPVRLAEYEFPSLNNFAEFSTNYRQPLWEGDLALGLVLKQAREYSDVREYVTFPAIAQNSGLESDRARNGEARLEYARPIGLWGQVRLFAVHRQEEQDEISQTTTIAGTDRARSLFNQREDVGRLAWQLQQGDLKLDAGVEGTINVLYSRSTLTINNAPVVLPAANLRVEEQRAEFFATATQRFSPVLLSELGLRYETSTLTQSGDSSLVKDLSFWKPRWLTTWDVVPDNQLRFLVERQVGQLNFRNFAATTSLNSNVVNAGNRNLEPPRSWIFALTWERHFWERGSLVLEARQEHIENVVDHIPVFAGLAAFDAIGNIGSGRRDQVEASMILPLDEIGLTGVTFTGSGTYTNSRVRDPATGFIRPISGDQEVVMHFEATYDRPQDNLRFGVNLHDHLITAETEYRIDEISAEYHVFKLGAFIEHKPAPDWTLRVFANDMAPSHYMRTRAIYGGLRGATPLSLIERRRLTTGAQIGIRVQHDFQ